MKRYVVTTLLFVSLVLGAGCQTVVNASNSATSTPQSTATIPSATITVTATPTEVPIASLTAEQLAERYLNGTLENVASLSQEQLVAFSKSMTQRLEERRENNVVSYTYKGENYFINPNTLLGELVPANPDQEFLRKNTIEMYLPVGKDGSGNIQLEINGSMVTIPNTADIDWRMVISDPHDPRINWPNTPPIGFGEDPSLTNLQRYISERQTPGIASNMIPGILLDKQLGEVILESGPAYFRAPCLKIATIVTDASGTPLYARVSLMIADGAIMLSKEGESWKIPSTSKMTDYGNFYKTLEANSLYYFAITLRQEVSMGKSIHASANNLDGFAPINKNSEALFENKQNEDDLMLILVNGMVKKMD